MSLQSVAKYDALSDMRIPFEVAAWARGHRFNPVTVNLVRKLREISDLTSTIEQAEKARDKAEAELRSLCETAKQKMECEHAV